MIYVTAKGIIREVLSISNLSENHALSSNYTQGPGSNAANNGSSFSSRREARAGNSTGALPALGSTPETERTISTSGSYEFDYLINSLHDLFERDRQIASQSDATRCGICYLYHTVSELHYREEGFYVCEGCERALGKHTMPMLRKQQK